MADETQYQVIITMDQNTADKLYEQDFTMYVFKAVNGPANGMPVVWISTKTYGKTTTVKWEEVYHVFTSRTTEIDDNTSVRLDNDYPADLGSLLTVDSPTGTGEVTENGPRGAISVFNDTSTQFVCGISQAHDGGGFTPLAAFPLYGHSEDEMVPKAGVFLMFASRTIDTGTVIEKSFSSGIWIDLTGAPAQEGVLTRNVSYDLNKGWDDNNAPWGRVLPPNTNLVPLLINGRVPGAA